MLKYLTQVAEGLAKAHAAITNDLNSYLGISLNTDSSVLVTVQEIQASDIWIAPDGDAGRATRFTSVSSNLDGFDGVRWTPDGKIVFNSMSGGRDGIRIMDADGTNRKQLTTVETVDYNPQSRQTVATSFSLRSARARPQAGEWTLTGAIQNN